LAAPSPKSYQGLFKHARSTIVCAHGTTVTWCAGHILSLANPEAYGPELKPWRLDTLPIVPKQWKYTESNPELLNTIKELLQRATVVVHAGDPDREGHHRRRGARLSRLEGPNRASPHQ
jgi:DNA topoisomerase III